MKAEVYDTYVNKKDGSLMHFDIIVPPETTYDTVVSFGKKYLEQVGQAGQQIDSSYCRFCHIEEATSEMESAFAADGFFILPMEGCPSFIVT